jgi:hypothetical protein
MANRSGRHHVKWPVCQFSDRRNVTTQRHGTGQQREFFQIPFDFKRYLRFGTIAAGVHFQMPPQPSVAFRGLADTRCNDDNKFYIFPLASLDVTAGNLTIQPMTTYSTAVTGTLNFNSRKHFHLHHNSAAGSVSTLALVL